MKSGGLPDILPTVATLFWVSLKVVAICYTCVEMCIMQLRYKYHTENISIREDLLRKKVVSFDLDNTDDFLNYASLNFAKLFFVVKFVHF